MFLSNELLSQPTYSTRNQLAVTPSEYLDSYENTTKLNH